MKSVRLSALVVLACLALPLIPPAQGQTVKVLYSFAGGSDGAYPSAALSRDRDGNLYGTTEYGGASGAGTVFKVNSAGQETLLYSFTGGKDGGSPEAALVRDARGNLYGTTYLGGSRGAGTVFKIGSNGAETVLHSFTGGADGGYPYAGLLLDSSGTLYGTTVGGGASDAGTVFQLSKTRSYKVLYSFAGGTDGQYPYAGVIRDSKGNLYGTTVSGGDGCNDCGTVFELSPGVGEQVLYRFKGGGADGANPYAALTRDSSGNLYGTTLYGGTGSCSEGCGTVFELSSTGQETVLYFFLGDGAYPYGRLVRDSGGTLYGTTSAGGGKAAGIAFALSPAGQLTVLYSFEYGSGPAMPWDAMIQDSEGHFYATSLVGGTVGGACQYGCGTVFELTP